MPQPHVGEAGGLQTRHYHRCRPPTSWLGPVLRDILRDILRDMLRNILRDIRDFRFWFFIFPETYICFRSHFNADCNIGKKVQKNFLMGLKIW